MNSVFPSGVTRESGSHRGVPRAALGAILTFVFNAIATFAVYADGDTRGEPGPSTLEFPVTVDLVPLYSRLDSRIPWRMGSGRGWRDYNGIQLQYDIWRGPLRASMAGDRLRASIPLGYRVRARKSVAKVIKVTGSCGVDEPPRGVSVYMESRLSWGKDWNLLSDTRVYPSRFMNPCLMTFASIDVTPVIDRELSKRLVRLARETIDRQVPSMSSVEAQAAQAWSALQSPVALDEGIWLMMRPESFRVGPLNGRGAVLETSIGVTARPRIVFGPRPPAGSRPLPDLQPGRHSPRGFHVEVRTAVRGDELRTLLESRLGTVMRRFGGATVELESVEVDAVGDSIRLTIHAASPLAVSLRLTGSPAYDREDGEIYLKDVALENLTPDRATNRVERWILDGLGGQLEQQARWPVSVPFRTALDRFQTQLGAELAGGIDIEFEIRDIRFHDVRSTRDELSLTATLEGSARLRIGEGPARPAIASGGRPSS